VTIKIPEGWEERLNHALVIESERAIKQRDKFLETGVVTAGNGGSHDTAFSFIVNKFMNELKRANEMTTTIKVEAHCASNKQVVVTVRNRVTGDVKETFTLQDGEKADRVVYDDLELVTYEELK